MVTSFLCANSFHELATLHTCHCQGSLSSLVINGSNSCYILSQRQWGAMTNNRLTQGEAPMRHAYTCGYITNPVISISTDRVCHDNNEDNDNSDNVTLRCRWHTTSRPLVSGWARASRGKHTEQYTDVTLRTVKQDNVTGIWGSNMRAWCNVSCVHAWPDLDTSPPIRADIS